MKIKKFEELHKSSGLKHKWVAEQIKVMANAGDKVGEMYWHNVRNGNAVFPSKYRGRKVKKLAEIYGRSVDTMMNLFGLQAKE